MAISKPITGSNGITTSYHRIYTIVINVNNEIIVEITSYLDQENREEEKYFNENALELAEKYQQIMTDNWKTVQPAELEEMLPQTTFQGYTTTRTVRVPYEEDFDVVRAYEWLTENDELLQGGEEI